MENTSARRAEQVREILATREVTFYRISQLSVEMFGRSSLFYLPHNLHSDLTDSDHLRAIRLKEWLCVELPGL